MIQESDWDVYRAVDRDLSCLQRPAESKLLGIHVYPQLQCSGHLVKMSHPLATQRAQ
jgi:hypothetical protein